MSGWVRQLRSFLLLLWTLRGLYLAVAIFLWLTGYLWDDGWEQRAALRSLLPFFILTADLQVKTIRETRWLWAVAGLLLFQMLSRTWSGGGTEPVSN